MSIFGGGSSFGGGGFSNNNAPSGGSNSFGAPSSSFGAAPASTGFRANTSSFGAAPSFVNTGNTGFGGASTSGFGSNNFQQPQSQSSGFGAPAAGYGNQSTSFGGNSFAPQSNTGGGGMFGGGTTSNSFGQTNGASSNTFGQTNTAPSTSGFGNNTSSFGSTPSNTFGNSGTGFGTTPANTNSFGGSFGGTASFGTQPAVNSFNAPQVNTGFGAQPSSTFGAQTSSFGSGGGFNSFGSNSTGAGTSAFPYSMTVDTGSTSGESFVAITAMDRYQGKSLEQLRWEDYQSNNKTGSTISSTGGGFGVAPTSTFGAAPTYGSSMFGQPPASTNTTFGAAQPTAFGSTFQSTSTFGQQNNSTSGGGLFIAQGPMGGGGLFGSSNSTQPSFGAAPTQTSLFGGAQSSNSFAPPPQSNSLFGNTGGSSSLFGGAPAPAATNSGLFGSTSAGGSTSLFGGGTSNTQGGMFGAPTNPAQSTSGSFFNTGTGGGTSLFSGQQAQSSMFGGGNASSGGGLFANTAPNTTSQFGSPQTSLFGGAPSSSMFGNNMMPQQQQQPISTQLTIAPPQAYATGSNSQMARHIELAKKAWEPIPNKESKVETVTRSSSNALTPMKPRGYNRTYQAVVCKQELPSVKNSNGRFLSPGLFDLDKKLSINKANRVVSTPSKKLAEKPPSKKRLSYSNETPEQKSPPLEDVPAVEETTIALRSPTKELRSEPFSRACPTMSGDYIDAGYTVNPSLKELEQMTEKELKSVSNFTVAREGFGQVQWLGRVDVTDLVIDQVVEICDMSIEVYTKETPERGTKLNRQAICTIEHMEIPEDFLGSVDDFVKYLKNELCPQLDALFIDYDKTLEQWTFQVQHFTKYGFDKSSTPYPSAKKKSVQNLVATALNFDEDIMSDNEEQPEEEYGKKKKSPEQQELITKRFSLIPRFAPAPVSIQKTCLETDVLPHTLTSCYQGPVNAVINSNLRPFTRRPFSVSWGASGQICFGVGNRVVIQRVKVGAREHVDETRLRNFMDACESIYEEPELKVKDCLFSLRDQTFFNSHEHLIWDLVSKLWFDGFPPQELMDKIDHPPENWITSFPDKNNEADFFQRKLKDSKRESVAAWLKSALCEFFVSDWKSDILSALSCGQFEVACKLAIKRGDLVLSSLIVSGVPSVYLKNQVGLWTDKVDNEMMRIYRVLGGDVSHEIADSSKHWLRAFALHFFYSVPPREKLETSLAHYQDAFQKLNAPPPCMAWNSSENDAVECYDTLFSLLSLVACPDYDFVKVLDRAGHSPMVLDSGMMWMLNRILKSFQIFGKGLSPLNEAKLTMSYAHELECIGMWEHALFVVQFLTNDDQRYSASVELLRTHADSSVEELSPSCQFLIDKVGVPPGAVYHALAIRAKYFHQTASSLLAYGLALEHDDQDPDIRSGYFESIIDLQIANNAIADGDVEILPNLYSRFPNQLEKYIGDVDSLSKSDPGRLKTAIFSSYSNIKNLDRQQLQLLQDWLKLACGESLLRSDVANIIGEMLQSVIPVPDSLLLPARHHMGQLKVKQAALSFIESF